MQRIYSLIVIVLILALIFGVGYFFWKNQKLSAELTLLKSSDLAKEVEILTFKLNKAEQDIARAEEEASRLDSRNKTLEAAISKIKPYLTAMDAVQLVVLGTTGPTREVVGAVDPKITALNDAEISVRWADAKMNVNFEEMSWQQSYFGTTISTIITRIFSFLP